LSEYFEWVWICNLPEPGGDYKQLLPGRRIKHLNFVLSCLEFAKDIRRYRAFVAHGARCEIGVEQPWEKGRTAMGVGARQSKRG